MHAFGRGDWSNCPPANQASEAAASEQSTRPVPILLIEIRDGFDLNAANNDDSYRRQLEHKPNSPWRALQQLAAPPETLWEAGHTSVTRRNRRELCLLETAYADKFSIHHVVFDNENPEGEYQPLNWHLTKNQMQVIRILAGSQKLPSDAPENERTKQAKAAAAQIRGKLKEAAEWTARVRQSGLNDQDTDPVCEVALPK